MSMKNVPYNNCNTCFNQCSMNANGKYPLCYYLYILLSYLHVHVGNDVVMVLSPSLIFLFRR